MNDIEFAFNKKIFEGRIIHEFEKKYLVTFKEENGVNYFHTVMKDESFKLLLGGKE